MSSTVRSYGVMAVLNSPLDEEQYETLSEELYENRSTLRINYEGTILYIDFNVTKPMSEREEIYGLKIQSKVDLEFESASEKLRQEAEKAGLAYQMDTVNSYDCIWYNGGDNPCNQLTLKEYQQRIGVTKVKTPKLGAGDKHTPK